MLSAGTRCLIRLRRNGISPVHKLARVSYSNYPFPFDEKKELRAVDIQQQLVVETLKHSNVVLSARPGCGKTATAIKAIQQNPDKRVLFITYTRHLRNKFAEKASPFDNVTVQTFHE